MQTQALLRVQLLVDGLAFPLQVASILLLLPPVTGIRLEQIGLTFRRLGWNCLWGAAGWLILTPVCFGVNYGVIASLRLRSGVQRAGTSIRPDGAARA